MKELNSSVHNYDTRMCAFCGDYGDGDYKMVGRLLNVDANEWVTILTLEV